MLREQRSLGLLRKEGPPPTHFFVAKVSIVPIYALFERLSQGFKQKPSCFRKAFK